MRLNGDVREIIEEKYHDGTSNEILTHLKRNFQVYMVKSDYIQNTWLLRERVIWCMITKNTLKPKYLK